MFDPYEWAESFYDADWKSNEKEMMKVVYSLTEREAKEVCNILKEFETPENKP